MDLTMTPSKCLAGIGSPGATQLLLALLGGDMLLVVLHIVNVLTPFAGFERLFSVEVDFSLAECYQYLKLLAIVVLQAALGLRSRSPRYAALVLLFAYLLLDDSLQIHERLGSYLTSALPARSAWGLKYQDIGELLVSAGAGLLLLPALVWAYAGAAPALRKSFIDIGMLMALLVFFGVFVDTVHATISSQSGWKVRLLLTLLEDGGEMIALSLMLWYVSRLHARGPAAACYLCEWIGLLTRQARGVIKPV